MGRVRGTVKWFDPEKGWGFIRLDSGQEIFVHHSDIQGEGFRTLKDGEPVEFEVEKAERGPRARRVTEPGAEVAPQRSGADRGGGRDAAGGRRATRTPSGPSPSAAAQPAPEPSGLGSGSLDQQVRSALRDRYPFAR
jgi:CspA family cold shock protein